MNTRKGPSYPIIKGQEIFYWPEKDLVLPPENDYFTHHSSPGPTGRCDCCNIYFMQHAYDIFLDKPDIWAVVCHGCFNGLEGRLGPNKGQLYYRVEKSKWRAVPDGKTWKDVL